MAEEENKKEEGMFSSPEAFANYYATRFAQLYSNFVDKYNSNNWYNPIYANSSLKRFNTLPTQPTEENLIRWLSNPRYYEQELRSCSDWLNYTSEFYSRTITYCANLLNLDYELIPINPPDANAGKSTITLYKKQKQDNNDWLRKFRIKEQFINVLIDVMKSGGKYYYLREDEYSSYLQAMPDDYCYINGRTDVVGYTYAMNMAFFYQFPDSVYGFAPEFADWYDEFLDKQKQLNNKANPYRMMPIDNAVVFKFDDTRPEIVPPFSGVFKDAIEIENYKDLLKLKAQLDTFQILYLKIPLDKENRPSMSEQQAATYAAVAQGQVPTGVGIVTSPMEMQSTKFTDSQNINNIIGLGATNYYQSSGLTPALFGTDTKSAVGIQNSITADYLMMSPIYDQFERFINWNLSKIKGKFNFQIHFLRRSNFELDDDITHSISLLQTGGTVSRAMSSMGYEPWQHEATLLDNKLCGLTDLLTPPDTSFTKSSSNQGGRPENSVGNISDSKDDTKTYAGNENKFSIHRCLNCGKEINGDKMFCNDDCKLEWAKNVVDEGGE